MNLIKLVTQPALSLPVVAWSADWVWGLPLIVFTVIFHSVGLHLINERVERVQSSFAPGGSHRVALIAIISGTVSAASLLHGIEAMIWACACRLLGALPDYSSAVLYSLGAMTTYGGANLFLEKRWQLLGALAALNGLLLFGLTTAFLIQILQKAKEALLPDRPQAPVR